MINIEDEAGLWFARMDAENAGVYHPEFDAWLSRSDDHAKAYDRVVRANQESLLIADLPGYGPDRDRQGHDARAAVSPPSPSFWTSKTALAASLVLGLGLGTGFYRHQLRTPQSSAQATSELMLMTRLGEIRQFRLADGSALTLDTASRAQVSISAQGRRIHLLAGRMRLDIAENKQPFQVAAGAGQITVTRGVVDLALGAGQEALLRLLTGQAELRPLTSATVWSTPVQPVTAGQSLIFSEDRAYSAPADPLSAAGSFVAPDWPTGWVDCRAITLTALIELANRYSPRPIRLEATKFASLAVSGRFRISDTQGFAHNIADQYDLAIIEDSKAIHLRPK